MITIIVLLILAGVTIATLTGNNGILTKANEAKTSNTDSEASEQFSLLANEWIIEKNTGDKTLEKFLKEKEEKKQLSEIKDNGDGSYTIKQNGYQTIIDQNGKIGSVFNPEEWDKTATPENCFIWGSDTEGEEGYDVVVGYTQNIESYTKLKFPSRCTKIDVLNGYQYSNEPNQSSRSFCTSIKAIELPNTVVEIGTYAFCSSDWSTGFDNLEIVTIPNSVKTIGSSAFWFCESLNNVTIPDSVTSIGYNAFNNCTSLSNIEIPNSIENIGDNAFYNTAWYNNQPDGVVYAGKMLYDYKGIMPSNTSIQIKEGIIGITSNAFRGCKGLSSIIIPDSVTSIGHYAFDGCTSLSNITIPSSVISMSGWVFYGWTSSQTINIKGYPSAPASWSESWNGVCSAKINWNQ